MKASKANHFLGCMSTDTARGSREAIFPPCGTWDCIQSMVSSFTFPNIRHWPMQVSLLKGHQDGQGSGAHDIGERIWFVQPEKGKVQEKSYCCLQLSDWRMQRWWSRILLGSTQWQDNMQKTEVGMWENLTKGDKIQEQIAWKIVESPLWWCSRLDRAQPEESYWMRPALD